MNPFRIVVEIVVELVVVQLDHLALRFYLALASPSQDANKLHRNMIPCSQHNNTTTSMHIICYDLRSVHKKKD